MEQKEQLTTRIPSVSVVVPNLNQGRFLEEAILSIINQPGLDIRIAIMDAGSTDESISVIKKYESYVSHWQSKADGGQAAAINEGISLLPPSDYVCWLNADDIFVNEGLTRMAAFMEQNQGSIAVYAKAYITDVKNRVISPYPTQPFSIKVLAKQCFICQPATLIRREAWEEVRGLNDTLQMCLDYDLWWRLIGRGGLGYLEEFTACSRDHEETKTRNNQETHFNEAFQILKKYTGYVPLNWCFARAAQRRIRAPYLLRKLFEKMYGSTLYIINKFSFNYRK